ncbi:extracellular solute-binding protein [Rosenbergiella australiborealis]|uniref:extracellular solute-binding protein n=1 Tax=Rosenbergiella australiborealis TaxID=1544696 RepID=UPI001F4D5324
MQTTLSITAKKFKKSCLLLLLGLSLGSQTALAETLTVTYAGSMGVVMDNGLGPDFAKQHHVDYQGQGQGAYGMARLLAAKKVVADVFVSITPGPIDVLKQAGLVDQAQPVASTRMVIAYNPRSRFAPQLAKTGLTTSLPWWKILTEPGFRFGRTDPTSDPQGQNIIFTLKLAENYYQQPGLAQKIMGPVINPQQIAAEGGLLTRLQAGQIDAASGYESATRSAKLPYIVLPDEINLSNPDDSQQWYDKVSFTLTDQTGQQKIYRPQPLVFYAVVLKNAPHPQLARDFVHYLMSKPAQKIFKDNGYDQPKGKPF